MFQRFAAHQFGRRTLSDHFTAAQRYQVVAIACRHVDIMQNGNHRQAALLT